MDGMADPDLELRGGGGGLFGCPASFFPYICNFLCKIVGGPRPLAPTLDLPLGCVQASPTSNNLYPSKATTPPPPNIPTVYP